MTGTRSDGGGRPASTAGADPRAERVPTAGADPRAERVMTAGADPRAERVMTAGADPRAERVPTAGADPRSLGRRAVAEAVGTAFLLAAVIGSGIMGERLAGGNVAIALLANTIATGAALAALILTFGPVSGAHFNPAVSLADAWQGGLPWREVALYVAAQVLGAFAGVAAAHLMFGEPLFFASGRVRTGGAQAFSEFVATFGLLAVIWGCARSRSSPFAPFAVAAYITAAYWFTASTSFANPAVTLARTASDTFAGIRPADAPLFVLMQLAGAGAATALFRWLVPAAAPARSGPTRTARGSTMQSPVNSPANLSPRKSNEEEQ